MNMKLLAAGAALATVMAVPAFADSIDFSQYGAPGTAVASGSSGVTRSGVDFTISNADGFTEYLEDYAHAEAYSWAGEFNYHEVILFNNGDSGATTITFATPLSSILHVEAQANYGGDFTESMRVYDGATLLGTVSANADNTPGVQAAEGTMPYLSYVSGSADITSIVISTTNSGSGFALGGTGGMGGGVPEPATWAMMLVGFGGLGAAMRSTRRKQAAVA